LLQAVALASSLVLFILHSKKSSIINMAGAHPCFRTIVFALLSNGGIQAARIKKKTTGAHEELMNATGEIGDEAGLRCKYVLTRPSAEEEAILKDMLKPMVPSQIGKGADIKRRDPGRKHYKDLVFRSAWKVSNTPSLWALQRTAQELDGKNGNQEFPLPKWHGGAKVGLNEYLLWHGGGEEHLNYKVCKGPQIAEGAFGEGAYLADAADKMDQYVMHDPKYLKSLLHGGHVNDEFLPEQPLFGLVMRTCIGHYAMVQRTKYEGGQWHWKDPATGSSHKKKKRLWNDPSTAPFDHDTSIAVARHHEDIGGTRPNFYNEYVIPSMEQTAVEYIVVYDRV